MVVSSVWTGKEERMAVNGIRSDVNSPVFTSKREENDSKEGICFSDVIREYEEANKLTAKELKDSEDWRSASDEAWDKLLEGIDNYIDSCREISKEKVDLQRKAAQRASLEASAGMKSIAASQAVLSVASCGFYSGIPSDSGESSISDEDASGDGNETNWTRRLKTDDQTILRTAKAAQEMEMSAIAHMEEIRNDGLAGYISDETLSTKVLKEKNHEQNTNRKVLSSRLQNTSSDIIYVDKTAIAEKSFEEMWKSRYTGAKYHVMNASSISQGTWERNDFPFENFFDDKVDETAFNFHPSDIDSAMTDMSVQSRLNSTLGKKAIIVPPELEEKMKNDPKLAEKVMGKVERFIQNHPTRPGRVLSYLIALDENGDIAHFRVTGEGGHISGPSESELRRFQEEQEAKREKKILQENENREYNLRVVEERKRLQLELGI